MTRNEFKEALSRSLSDNYDAVLKDMGVNIKPSASPEEERLHADKTLSLQEKEPNHIRYILIPLCCAAAVVLLLTLSIFRQIGTNSDPQTISKDKMTFYYTGGRIPEGFSLEDSDLTVNEYLSEIELLKQKTEESDDADDEDVITAITLYSPPEGEAQYIYINYPDFLLKEEVLKDLPVSLYMTSSYYLALWQNDTGE